MRYIALLIIGIIFFAGCTGKVTEVESELQTGQTSESNKCQGKFEGTVERIFDGDTLKLKECDKSIRISLVDTPEDTEQGYQEAKLFTENLCKVGVLATIDQDDLQPYDRYNRIVALVYCQNKKLNAELIFTKLGEIDTRFCFESEFSDEEWANDCKTPPSETCDPSYPTVCISPSPPDLDCQDISYRRFTVLQPDPHRFDGDKDGIGCESVNTT